MRYVGYQKQKIRQFLISTKLHKKRAPLVVRCSEPGFNGSKKLYYGTWLLSNAKKESYAGGWPAVKIITKRWKYVNTL